MSPLNEQQLSQIRDERREQIKKAALLVFARRGVLGTTMRLIAKEAKISLGLSYSYFSSKEELYLELIHDALAEANKAFERVSSYSGTPKELLRLISEQMLEESNKPAFLLIHQVQTADGVPVEAKEILQQNSSNNWLEQFIPIIIKGQELGEFSMEDPIKLVRLYFSILTGLMLQDVEKPDVDLLMKILIK